MKRDLRFEVFYPHPRRFVWRALTEPAALKEWLMENDFEPKVGRTFQFRAPPQRGWSGIVNCRVVECDPPQRLVYTWDSDAIETTVSYTLTEEPGGTQLVLEHTGFSGFKAVMVSFIMGSGWKGHVLKGILRVVERMAAEGG